MLKNIVKGFAGLALVSVSAFSMAGCTVEEELSEGDKEYIALTEEEVEFLNDDQEKALVEARKEELKEMPAAERAVLPTKEQKEQKKEELSAITKELAEDIQ